MKINNLVIGYTVRFIILAVLTALITLVSIDNITYAMKADNTEETAVPVATNVPHIEYMEFTALSDKEPEERKETVYVPFDYKECVVDKDVQEYVHKYIEKYGNVITDDVVYSLIYSESRFDENATNVKTNCSGYMQLNPRYFTDDLESLGYESLYDKEANIELGVKHLSMLMEKYGDLGIALMCYERGEDGGLKYYESHKGYDSYANEIMERASGEIIGEYGEY